MKCSELETKFSSSFSWGSAVHLHKTVCDGSAAIPIGKHRFLTACDEDTKFYLFYNEADGYPLSIKTYSDFIKREDPNNEADLEACASIGKITYWIGSHSRTNGGSFRSERHQFFATKITHHQNDFEISFVGQPYTNLLRDLIEDESTKLFNLENPQSAKNKRLGCRSANGLNIEGLCAWHDSELLIGFRNPRPRKQALLIPLKNPHELICTESRAKFGKPILLDLGNRGIRDIQFWESHGIYLIIAGANNRDDNFALYAWTGKRSQAAVKISSLAFSSFPAESIVIYPHLKDRFLLLTDDGNELHLGVKRKLSHTKQFRSRWVSYKIAD